MISIGEIAKGIHLRKDGKKKDDLGLWLLTLERHYAERVLSADPDTSHIWGELTAEAQKKSKIISASYGLTERPPVVTGCTS